MIFNSGDVVKLKCSSHRMVVRYNSETATEFSAKGVQCDWIDIDGAPQNEVYLPEQLMKVT